LHQIIKSGEVGKDNQLRMYCIRFMRKSLQFVNFMVIYSYELRVYAY